MLEALGDATLASCVMMAIVFGMRDRVSFDFHRWNYIGR